MLNSTFLIPTITIRDLGLIQAKGTKELVKNLIG